MVVETITAAAAAAAGVVAGGYFLVRGIIRLFRSEPVKSPTQPTPATGSSQPQAQQPQALPITRIADAVKRAFVRGAERTIETAQALRQNAVAWGKRAFVVVRGAYRFAKAAGSEFLRRLWPDQFRPRLRVAYIITCDGQARPKPFLKIAPRIRDAIPADPAVY